MDRMGDITAVTTASGQPLDGVAGTPRLGGFWSSGPPAASAPQSKGWTPPPEKPTLRGR
jgi:hypothetical protein